MGQVGLKTWFGSENLSSMRAKPSFEFSSRDSHVCPGAKPINNQRIDTQLKHHRCLEQDVYRDVVVGITDLANHFNRRLCASEA
jgi:hypothetical protein